MSATGAVAAICTLVAIGLLLTPWWPGAPRPITAAPDAAADRRRDAAPRRIRPHRPPRHGRRRDRLLDRVVPDMLDLFVVSVHAGLTPPEALRRIAPAVHPAVADALDHVDTRLRRGERFADAIGAMVDHLGTRMLTFAGALAASDRTGLPLGPALERIAHDARLHRQHLVEAEARELPVRLSLPLVTCTLPSFALVAIAPLVIGAVSSLASG